MILINHNTMKNKNIFWITLGILLSSLLQSKAQSNTQVISYKIAFKAGSTSCYEVSFSPNQALNAPTNTLDKVSSAQVTIVAPAGTGAQITNLTPASGIAFNQTSTGGSFNTTPYPGNTALEYLTFGIQAFNPVVGAGSDFLLFSFCLNSSCTSLRLINGLSPDSPYTYTGTPDTKPTGLDPYNSMSFNTGSPLTLYESYKGNNSGSATCTSPDLTTTISPASGTGTASTNFTYTVCVNNIGTAATTGIQTTTITLPSGLSYIPTGSGNSTWTCTSAAGTGSSTVVTCTSPTSIAATNGQSCFPLIVQPQTANMTYNTNVTVATSGTAESSTTNNASSATLTTGGCAVNAGTLSKQ